MNDPSNAALPDPLALVPGGYVTGAVGAAQFVDDGAIDAQCALPPDHPAWQRDVVSISSRARGVLATLRPVMLRIVTFWDHAVRSVSFANGRRIDIDPSGCYRLR